MSNPIAFVCDRGSPLAYVFDGNFSAFRDINGKWTSPSPSVKPFDFTADYNLLNSEEAKSLSIEAKIELVSTECDFLDVEGIPVTIGAGEHYPYCAAWDVSPPREFDPGSARRNGYPASKSSFIKLILENYKIRDTYDQKSSQQAAIDFSVVSNKTTTKDSNKFESFMKKLIESKDS